MFEETRAQLEARKDPMIVFAKGLRSTLDEKERRDHEVAGAMMRLRPDYVALLQKLRKGRVYPDANGTLRVSFGKVEGYSPRDSIQYAAQTTLHGARLVVVANREPFLHVYEDEEIRCIRPASGLTTALDPVMRACGGVWVGQ